MAAPAIDPALAASLRAAHEHEQAANHRADLSSREVEVLRLVAGGLANHEIGAELRIGEETVKSHMRNLLVKLRARGRAHAVHLAHGRGLL